MKPAITESKPEFQKGGIVTGPSLTLVHPPLTLMPIQEMKDRGLLPKRVIVCDRVISDNVVKRLWAYLAPEDE